MLQRIEVQNNSYISDFIFVQLHAVFTIIMFVNIQYIKHIVDAVTKNDTTLLPCMLFH